MRPTPGHGALAESFAICSNVRVPAAFKLEPPRVVETIAVLRDRIAERFPDSGLLRVAGGLKQIGDAACQRAGRMRRPNIPLRLGIAVILLAVAALIVYIVANLRFRPAEAWVMLEGIDAALGSVVFLGALVLFMVTLETRLKRRRILIAVEELRELAHIIDMHQLTKDPERLTGQHQPTASSPKVQLTPFLLGRYLDYCSEMLSLIGKVALIYTHGSSDAVVLEAIDNIEDLTTGLSRKIWQKVMVLDHVVKELAQRESTREATMGEAVET